MKQTVGAKIGMGIAVALVSLVVIGSVSYRTTSRFTENARWVEHILQVLERLESVLGALNEAETLQREYLLPDAAVHVMLPDRIAPALESLINHSRKTTANKLA